MNNQCVKFNMTYILGRFLVKTGKKKSLFQRFGFLKIFKTTYTIILFT